MDDDVKSDHAHLVTIASQLTKIMSYMVNIFVIVWITASVMKEVMNLKLLPYREMI